MKKLERRLNLTAVVAIGIGGMLGSGIFVLPGIAAAKTGSSVWLAYLLAGICVLPAALSKSELATAMPASGGTYIYIERAFGPAFGTISGIGLWLSLLLKSSFALVGFGAYLLVLADLPLRPAALIFLSLIMLLNIMGVRKVGAVQLVIVSLSVACLAVLVFFSMVSVEPDNLDPFLTDGSHGLLAATAFVFVSYAGVTKVAAIAEEIKDPGKNLPAAMLLALATVTAVYTLVTFTMVGNVPVAELAGDIHPIYTFTETIGGKMAGIGAAVLGIVTLISMANSGVLAASRFPFAMSRDKLVPPAMSQLNDRFLTPVVAIVLTCLVMGLVIAFLDVERIAKLASTFKVMMFMTVNACVIVLRETAVQWYKPRYFSPGYPWVQIFGILSGAVLLVVLGSATLLAALVIGLVGFAIYYFYGRTRVQRSGVLKLYGHRPALYLLYRRRRRRRREKIDALEAAATPPVGTHLQSEGSLDGSLAEQAPVVITLFGKERSPEMLVEMGAALAQESKVQVVHLKEVPDQTVLDALLEDDPVVISLSRRLNAMAVERNVNVDFDAAVTHDLVETVNEISRQTHCEWLVSGWDGRSHRGLFIRNPIGWLVTHLDSNFALYKDNGVRYIRKVLVAMRPGRPGKKDSEFLKVCDRIVRFYGAEMDLVRLLPESATEEEIQQLTRQSSELFRHYNPEKEVIIQTSKNPIRQIINLSAAYDLLIIGTPDRENWLDVLMGTDKDKFATQAPCSVLRLNIKEPLLLEQFAEID
jgi:APA family basic amino acid/polyamine antiporter